jgi:hypothetical protein
VAVGTALGDEMQRLFRQQSEGAGKTDTINRRRGQALVGLVVGGAEAPGSATTTPLVNLVIGQKVLENFLERFVDPDTVWPCFASPTRVVGQSPGLPRLDETSVTDHSQSQMQNPGLRFGMALLRKSNSSLPMANSPTQRWIRRCLPGTSPAILRPGQQVEGEFCSAKLGVASTP